MVNNKKENTRNVLLTTLFSLNPDDLNYCMMQSYSWRRQYCTMILPAEASAKQTLSLTPIDEIIVLGEKASYIPGEEDKQITLKEYEPEFRDGYGDLSQYGQFCYRMKQYLNNEDAECKAALDAIPKERQEELEKELQEAYLSISDGGKKFGIDRFFDMLQSDDEIAKTARENILSEKLPDSDVSWLEARAYQLMTDSLKCIALDTNLDVKARFISASASFLTSTNNIISLIKAIGGDGERSVNLIADLHSLNLTDSHSILSLLAMMTSVYEGYLNVQSMLCVDYNQLVKKPAVVLFDWSERYSISELVGAVNTFKNYGKAEPLEVYWKIYGDADEKVDNIIYAMKNIDSGISLCDITELEYGINRLKDAVTKYMEMSFDNDRSFIHKVFRILMYGLVEDYGELLTDEKPNLLALLKWCERKKLYQQALTLIEARIPEYLTATGIFYYCRSEEESTHIKEILNELYYNDPPFTRYKYDNMDHYMIKFFGRDLMRKNGGKNEKAIDYADFMKERVLTGRAKDAGKVYEADMSLFDQRSQHEVKRRWLDAYSVLDDVDILRDLLVTYYFIGNIRNSINHAGDDNELDFSDAREVGDSLRMRKVVQITQHFIKTFEKAVNGVEGKPFEIYHIEGKEFRIYTNSHRPDKDYYPGKGGKGGKGKPFGPKVLGNIKDMINKHKG